MKKSLILVLAPLLLTSCTLLNPTKKSTSSEVLISESVSETSSNNPSSETISSEELSSEEESDSLSEEETSSSSEEESESEESSLSSSQSISSEEESSSQSSSSKEESSTPLSSSSSEEEDDERPLLDCGYYAMPLPKNHDDPEVLTTTLSSSNYWSENVFQSDLPEDFRYAYHNSYDNWIPGKTASPKFYSSNEHEGLKLNNGGLGFQTRQFSHIGAKLEVRMSYQLYSAGGSGKPVTNVDTASIYAFNATGELLGKYTIAKETLKTTSTVNTLKFYWTDNAMDVAYFEFRLNAEPYKSSQVYNTEIISFNYKSWEKA